MKYYNLARMLTERFVELEFIKIEKMGDPTFVLTAECEKINVLIPDIRIFGFHPQKVVGRIWKSSE